MFGKKKKTEDSLSINQNYVDDNLPNTISDDLVRQQNQQFQSQPVYQQPVQVQQFQPQFQQQPVQRVQPQRTAIIIETKLQDNGEFVNTIVTNYQLNIGYCRLDQ